MSAPAASTRVTGTAAPAADADTLSAAAQPDLAAPPFAANDVRPSATVELPVAAGSLTARNRAPSEAGSAAASGHAPVPVPPSVDTPGSAVTAGTPAPAPQAFALPVTAPEALSQAAASAAPTPARAAPTAAPAAQVAPALLAMGQNADGGQQMTLRLHPAELGMVQVQIDKTATGAANVAITVEKPETLQAMLRDQADLHHALDAAGIPSLGRTLTINLAPESALGAGTSGFGQSPQQNAPQTAATNTGSNASAGGGNQTASGDGQAAGQGTGRGGYPSHDQSGYAAAAARGQSDASTTGDTAAPGRWQRVGLNITA